MTIKMIVAVGNNQVIGVNGKLPWHIPEDLCRFKKETIHKPIIMGRSTWESLPIKPLSNRDNIVISSSAGFKAEGAIVVNSPAKALSVAMETKLYKQNNELYIIGGERLYRDFLYVADQIIYTKVYISCMGDRYFPVLPDYEWEEAIISDKMSHDGVRFQFLVYTNKRPQFHIQEVLPHDNGKGTMVVMGCGDEKRFMMANECLDANAFVLPIKIKPEYDTDFDHFKIFKNLI